MILLYECIICYNGVTIIRSLWNYYKDEINDDAKENKNKNRTYSNKKITSKSFDYSTKLIGSTPNDSYKLYTVVVPLK